MSGCSGGDSAFGRCKKSPPPGENNRSCWRVRKRGEKGTVSSEWQQGLSQLKAAVAVKLVGCAGQLCLRCLRLQPVGLNSFLESRKGEFCVCCVVTYFFWPPVMGLTFGISLEVKWCDLLALALGLLSIWAHTINPAEIGTCKFFKSQELWSWLNILWTSIFKHCCLSPLFPQSSKHVEKRVKMIKCLTYFHLNLSLELTVLFPPTDPYFWLWETDWAVHSVFSLPSCDTLPAWQVLMTPWNIFLFF